MTITATFRSIEEMQDFAAVITEKTGLKETKNLMQGPELLKKKQEPENVAAPQTQPQAELVTPAPVMAVGQPAATPAVPTAQTSYSLDDLARAAMTLMDCGKQEEIQKLLADFNVAALPMLPPAQYGAFATGLRGLGAKI